MGYDRNDPWMTCGERDDKEVSDSELERAILFAWNHRCRDGFEPDKIGEYLRSRFIILNLS